MNLLKYLLFVPSINFSLLPQSEIFPWAFIYGIKRSKVSKSIVILLFLFLISSLYGIYVTLNPTFEIFRSILAYLNCLLIFDYILQKKVSFEKEINGVFKFLIILGILQHTEVLSFLNPFFKLIIPRGSLSSLNDFGGRGVTMLATEPERAYLHLTFLYCFFRKSKNLSVKWDILYTIYGIIILKSLSGFIFNILVLTILNKKYAMIGVLTFFGIILASLSMLNTNRVFVFLSQIMEENSFEELTTLLINLSGFRLISLLTAFQSAISNPFGLGVGQWKYSSLEALQSSKYNPMSIDYFRDFANGHWVSLRPTSFFSNIALDLGLFGIILILLFLIYKFQSFQLKNHIAYMLIFFLYLFIFGAAGDPVPWIVISSILVLQKKPKSKIHGVS